MILYVEDNQDNRRVVQRLLQPHALSVTAVEDGEAALAYLQENPAPALILMDLFLPGLSGFETTQLIQQLDAGREVPIVCHTANAYYVDQERDITVRDQALAIGHAGYIPKPVPHDFIFQVKQFLSGYREPLPDAKKLLAALTAYSTEVVQRLRTSLTVQQQMLEQMNVFMAAATHELRTPLAILQTNLSIWRRGRALPQTGQDPLLVDCADAAATLNGRVEDILTLSKIESGQLTLHRQQLDLNHFLAEFVTRHRTHCQTCSLTILPAAPVTVPADPARLAQILENLVENAHKYRAERPLAITLSLSPREQEICFAVTDNGPGIGDTRPLFRPFSRLPEAEKLAVRGLGIGLFLVKELAAAHGGQVGVESTPGTGSTFWFTLPRRINESIGSR